jgi:peptide deformylase
MKLTKRVLHLMAKPVEYDYPARNQQLAQDLFVMMNREDGIGLAAPQVGIRSRVFVMEIDGRRRACFNPEIQTASDDLVEFNEGCLSFRGDQCTIKRPSQVRVRYQDHQGQWISDCLSGLEARCFQHELDHLDGITMWDRYREQNAEQSRN